MAIRNQILQVLNETILTRNIWSMKGQPSAHSQDKPMETTSMPNPIQDKIGNIHISLTKAYQSFRKITSEISFLTSPKLTRFDIMLS